ncbi:glutathione S-transferase family protein [Hyphococcus sp.]|uniref:glutathione S-transferase family protein n=1 Tax=Hyphococcus sp. TaxID=2038636 RepID=UPI0020874534|nr:MAG: glutathione S-transferase [Marinicaulis sp.]
MANPIKIIGLPASQNVRKPLAVAHHLGLDVESVVCMPGDDTIKAVNPSGRIPAMDDNGFILSESNAIMIHLAGKRPNSLYPDDVEARAKVNQWLMWDMAHWTPAYQPIQFEKLVKQKLNMGPADEARVEKTLELFHREAGYLDAALAGRDWLVGDAPTLADFAVGAGLTHAVPIALPLEKYDNVRVWNDRVMGLDGFKKTAPGA